MKKFLLVISLVFLAGCSIDYSKAKLVESKTKEVTFGLWKLTQYNKLVHSSRTLGYVKIFQHRENKNLQYRIYDLGFAEKGRVLSNGNTYIFNHEHQRLENLGSLSLTQSYSKLLGIETEYKEVPFVELNDN